MEQLRDHQEKALAKLGNGKILMGDMGTGKSRVAMAYYAKHEAPKTLYVITTAKKRDSLDWDEEALHYNVSTHEDSVWNGLMFVDSWNNIHKYTGIENAFFIFDEQRIVGTGKWTKSFYKIAAKNNWILLSATPGDTWLDYIPVFVANGFYPNITAFKREHVIYNTYAKFPKVDRYTGVGKLVRLRNEVLVHMPMQRTTVRHSKIIPVDYDVDLFTRVVKDRWHVYENRPLRDVAELFSVMRKVVNSEPDRVRLLRGLMETHPKLIVFYNFDYELDSLRSLSNTQSTSEWDGNQCHSELTPLPATTTFSGRSDTTSSSVPAVTPQSDGISSSSEEATSSTTESTPGFTIAEWNGHKHEPIPKTDRWVYLVQYAAGAEGWNCIETDAMVFFTQTYSYRAYYQAHGRIDRLNTPFTNLFYYNLVSSALIDTLIRKCLDGKRSFNESAVGRELGGMRSNLGKL